MFEVCVSLKTRFHEGTPAMLVTFSLIVASTTFSSLSSKFSIKAISFLGERIKFTPEWQIFQLR